MEEKTISSDSKHLATIGKIASVLACLMYVSYITQIISNLNGNPVSFVQPLVASANGLMWTLYGWLRVKKDWPLIVANFPGVVFGLITVITSFIH
ncbi:SemiSWEET family transporter [Companilactobacillus furfuricola]|uniref:SemiSWEET family transporter n=1 Tax=Companilactobacillus furfuricola TaxID=1462575 RepID=UPI000F7877DC|nr:SemiSWEET family transporter [Companilactobacillus furfuricola]